MEGKNTLLFKPNTCIIEIPVYRYIPKFFLRHCRKDEDTIFLSRRTILTVNSSLRLPAELYTTERKNKVMQKVKIYYPDNEFVRAGVVRLLYDRFWDTIYSHCHMIDTLGLPVVPHLKVLLQKHFQVHEEILKIETARRKWARWKEKLDQGNPSVYT
ncbi:MAG: hypothetical protein AAF740_01645 [Bacteroidota bacterium]